jgi:hypothetical protein
MYTFGDSRGAVGRANAAEPEVRGHDGLRDQAADRLCAGPWVLRWLIKLGIIEATQVVFAGAPRDPRGMGQPPTATRHRVTGGGEPCPQGADDYRTITAQLPAFLAGRPGTMGRTGGRRWSGARSRPTSGAGSSTTACCVCVYAVWGHHGGRGSRTKGAGFCPSCGLSALRQPAPDPGRGDGAPRGAAAPRGAGAGAELPPGPPSPPPDPPSLARPSRHRRSRLSVPAGKASWARPCRPPAALAGPGEGALWFPQWPAGRAEVPGGGARGPA